MISISRSTVLKATANEVSSADNGAPRSSRWFAGSSITRPRGAHRRVYIGTHNHLLYLTNSADSQSINMPYSLKGRNVLITGGSRYA